MSKWISVEERLPYDELVLVHAPSSDPALPLITVAMHTIRGWIIYPKAFAPAITHWMPLPPPPGPSVGWASDVPVHIEPEGESK